MKPQLSNFGLLRVVMHPESDELTAFIYTFRKEEEVAYPGYYLRMPNGEIMSIVFNLVNDEVLYEGRMNNLLRNSQVDCVTIYAPSGKIKEIIPTSSSNPLHFPTFDEFLEGRINVNGYTLINGDEKVCNHFSSSVLQKYPHHFRFRNHNDSDNKPIIDTSHVIKSMVDKWTHSSKMVKTLLEAEDRLAFSLPPSAALNHLQYVRKQIGKPLSTVLQMEDFPVLDVLTNGEIKLLIGGYSNQPVLQELLLDELRYRESGSKNE